MKRLYPKRSVNRYIDWCCVCQKVIPVNTCVSRIFNMRSHKECEPRMVEKYRESVTRGAMARAAQRVR